MTEGAQATEHSSVSISIDSATAFLSNEIRVKKLINASDTSGLFIAVAEACAFPNIRLENREVMVIYGNDLSIPQIINSGQCFRNRSIGKDRWEIWYLNKRLDIYLVNGMYIFDCCLLDFMDIWFDYFDFGLNYSEVKRKVLQSSDDFLIRATEYGYGLRILKQDFWEMVVTFIISQRNNIPKIKTTIGRMCDYFGGKFPSPMDICECSIEDIRSFGVGYRDRYIMEAARRFSLDSELLGRVQNLGYNDLIDFLKTFTGIGIKVADCIALFGAHKIEAFPIDVWMQRILEERYPGGFKLDQYANYAGIIQQYMYFYQRFLYGKETSF